MARFNLNTSIKKLVTASVRLLSKAFKPTAPARPSVFPKQPRLRPQTPQPVPDNDYWKKQIEALIQQNQAQARRIAELENRQKELQELIDNKPPEPEHITPADLESEVESFTEDDLPYEIKDDVPEFGPDDLPYEIKDDEPIDTTYKNFGSDDSINTLLEFLRDTKLSGISPESPFFDMDPLDQKFILLDYVQFQHDSNPALFYKGRRSLALENVPIWGSEFDRYVSNAYEFDNIQNDGTGKNIDLSWMDDLLTEI